MILEATLQDVRVEQREPAEASPAEALPAEQIDLRALARQSLADHDGIVLDAVEALMTFFANNPEKLRATLTHAVRIATLTVVEHSMRNDRQAILRDTSPAPADGPTKPRISGADMVSALARGARRQLLDYPLATGIKLRDATREQVAAQADFHERAEVANGFKRRWFRAIERLMPDDLKVGEVLTEDDVQALREDASNE